MAVGRKWRVVNRLWLKTGACINVTSLFLQISINFNKSQILTQTEQVRLGGWKMAGGCAMTAVLEPSSWPLGKAVCRPWAIDFPKGFLFRFLASKNEKPLWLEEWKLKCFN